MADNRKFIADVERFGRLTVEKMLRVAKQSTDDVVREAQTPVAKGGNMPVDTGVLRNSLVTEVNGVEAGVGADSFVLGIAQLQLGDVLTVAWTADYAIPRHYMVGVGQGGGLWRDKAAAKWSGIVDKNARAIRGL
ncbi:hypothetical protein UFOVP317_27 [uncultured Caudovirales phage]|uniref:Uncharacterized protein n=1 Tax=uncultured Caudovirales phage TaxID=2100421 RepID=A0A6J5LT29_9CAUD|nr:hypothetical protein UFOVP317_27 [uncultured Caudovirales phage]